MSSSIYRIMDCIDNDYVREPAQTITKKVEVDDDEEKVLTLTAPSDRLDLSRYKEIGNLRVINGGALA